MQTVSNDIWCHDKPYQRFSLVMVVSYAQPIMEDLSGMKIVDRLDGCCFACQPWLHWGLEKTPTSRTLATDLKISVI